ncbi:MAG: hypothetical protein ACREPE_04295 [Lysobacter sp.]
MTAWLWPLHAPTQVRRCTAADGSTVFTDRRCADIGGVERLPRDGAAARMRQPYRGGCARNLQDLVFEITTAIDTRDVNRLASVYHWAGMSSRQGYALLARLDGVVKRPLVDIAPVMPASPDGIDGDLYPQTTVRRAPVGLRIDQTLANGITSSSTVFGLRKHFECWWVSF